MQDAIFRIHIPMLERQTGDAYPYSGPLPMACGNQLAMDAPHSLAKLFSKNSIVAAPGITRPHIHRTVVLFNWNTGCTIVITRRCWNFGTKTCRNYYKYELGSRINYFWMLCINSNAIIYVLWNLPVHLASLSCLQNSVT